MCDIPPHPYLPRMWSGQCGCSMCGSNMVFCYDTMCDIPPNPYLPRMWSGPCGCSMSGSNVVFCCDVICDIPLNTSVSVWFSPRMTTVLVTRTYLTLGDFDVLNMMDSLVNWTLWRWYTTHSPVKISNARDKFKRVKIQNKYCKWCSKIAKHNWMILAVLTNHTWLNHNDLAKCVYMNIMFHLQPNLATKLELPHLKRGCKDTTIWRLS